MSPPCGGLFCPGSALIRPPSKLPIKIRWPRLRPVGRALIVINVIVFALQWASGGAYSNPLYLLFALWPPHAGAPHFHAWQLLTYGFLHASWAHLFFNMLGLYMFGSMLERWVGSRRFLIYYLLCVIGAALLHLAVVAVAGRPPLPMVGASGGIFGLLIAFGMKFPTRRVLVLLPPMIVPAWLFVTLYGIFELVMGVTQTLAGVAHFAHLGGMITGFVIIRCWRAPRRARRLARAQVSE
jgi:membrane associated rhomboid family serine protease